MPRRTNHPLTVPVFNEPAFGEGGRILPDPQHFAVTHLDSKAIYDQPGMKDALIHDVVPFDRSRAKDGDVLALADALGTQGPDFVKTLTKQIVFHCIGDSGATQEGRRYQNELGVADLITAEVKSASPEDSSAFLYHLGDVVYDFGEAEYYYDQFYDPFRNYARPIFAIAGNHDSFIVPGTPPEKEPLKIFARNFCATGPTITPEARSLHRTAMIQPGVYFTLDAPFVRIIGLFSNALEDPGVISSEGGTWPDVPDFQLDYLRAQLQRIRDEKYAGAVLVALHHPPFSYSPGKAKANNGTHAGSTAALREIDGICSEIGVYPHAFISGHAHNYQRYTRTLTFKGGADYQVPFVVCGNGGHNCNPLVYQDSGHHQDPVRGADVSYLEAKPAVKAKSLTIDGFDDYNYGYLRVTVDKKQLAITYVPTGNKGGVQPDPVIVDLATHRLVPTG